MVETHKLIKAAAFGECLGAQCVRWPADAFKLIFEDEVPQLLDAWPHRIRRLPQAFVDGFGSPVYMDGKRNYCCFMV